MKDVDKVNQYYKDTYSCEQVVEELIYFTNKSRGKNFCSLGTIRRAYQNDTLGKLIKKMDIDKFNKILNGKESN
jgi:hypothetical protein